MTCNIKNDRSISCPNNSHCAGKSTVDDLIEFRKGFWGDITTDKPPTQSQRTTEMEKILKNSFNASSKSFEFRVANRKVCERGFLICLGINLYNL